MVVSLAIGKGNVQICYFSAVSFVSIMIDPDMSPWNCPVEVFDLAKLKILG
jgi:hypothetical protein